MKTRTGVLVACAFALLVMLVPASSAQAAWRSDNWCMSSTSQVQGVVIAPNKTCVSWPLNVNSFQTFWWLHTAGKGRVCVGLTQFGGPNHGQPIAGVPGLTCNPLTISNTSGSHGQEGYASWSIARYNPWAAESHRYGQARIYNFSSATIEIVPNGNWLRHWVP